MPLFDERVLLCLHVPKCGGKTLNQIIFKNLHDETGVTVEQEWFYQGVAWFPMPGGGFLKSENRDVEERTRRVLRRQDLRAFLGHFSYGVHRHLSRPWAYCTMLRHPVDRVLSLHHHLRHRARMTIEEFVSDLRFIEVDNDQTRRISGEEPEVGRCSDEMLQKAKEHLETDFAVVGVTDRSEETFVLLSRFLGWNAEQLSSRRRNVSRNRTQSSDLPNSVREKLLERNEFDMKLYGYACSLLSDAVSRQDARFTDDVAALKARNASLPPWSFLD